MSGERGETREADVSTIYRHSTVSWRLGMLTATRNKYDKIIDNN